LGQAVVKGLVLFHRWAGTLLCLLFATWFATGAVMLFVPFPSLGAADKAAHAEPINLAAVRLTPAEVRAKLGATDGSLRLISLGGQPVYVARGKGGDQAVSAETGAPVPRLNAEAARSIATRFGGAPVESVSRPFDYDQWTVHQQFDAVRPLYRVRLADGAHTELSVSSRTGEVIQRTTRHERGWNWVGAVIHWVYIVPIRQSFALWDWTVWIVSLAGVGLALAGLTLGVLRAAAKRKRAGRSPFRGLLRWHHLMGLAGGIFVLAWITSGWLSMDHGRLFSTGEASAPALEAYRTGGPSVTNSTLKVTDLSRLRSATAVTFHTIGGVEIASASGAQGRRILMANASGAELADRLPTAFLVHAVQTAWPGATADLHPVAATDSYALAEGLPATAIRVPVGSAGLYLDGVDGTVLVLMDRSRAAYAWIYYMVHSYNYPMLAPHPAVRLLVILAPLTLGFAFSVTALLAGLRRFRSLLPKRRT